MRGKILDKRGVAAVLVLGVLVFFIIFFIVIAIDIAYVYVVRGEMQNAADAAAIAGSSQISDPADLVQANARAEAKEFALKNNAAGKPLVLIDNDISVGFWDGGTYTPGVSPVNAIKVVARRTGADAVQMLFGAIIDRSTMEVSRVAIAARSPRVDIPVALCINACGADNSGGGIINTSTGSKFIWGPTNLEQGNPYAAAFTDFAPDNSVNVGSMVAFFCGSTLDVCEQTIQTTQAPPGVVDRQFRCAFINPLFDSENKGCVNSSNTVVPCSSFTPGSGIKVKWWTPLVPIVDQCPPGNQPGPLHVIKYARAKITEVNIRSGGGVGSGSPNNCACTALGASNYIPSPINEYSVIINGITCASCDSDDIYRLLGRRGVLVK